MATRSRSTSSRVGIGSRRSRFMRGESCRPIVGDRRLPTQRHAARTAARSRDDPGRRRVSWAACEDERAWKVVTPSVIAGKRHSLICEIAHEASRDEPTVFCTTTASTT